MTMKGAFGPPAIQPFPKWRPAPHKYEAQKTPLLSGPKLAQTGILGVEWPLVALAIDTGAVIVSLSVIQKAKGTMKYVAWGVLVLSALRGVNDLARLVAGLFPAGR